MCVGVHLSYLHRPTYFLLLREMCELGLPRVLENSRVKKSLEYFNYSSTAQFLRLDNKPRQYIRC